MLQRRQRRMAQKKVEDSSSLDHHDLESATALLSGGMNKKRDQHPNKSVGLTVWHVAQTTRTVIRLFVLMGLLVLSGVFYFVFMTTSPPSSQHQQQRLLDQLDPDDLMPCTYTQLDHAFRPPTRTISPFVSSSPNKRADCSWKLEDEILRIPIDAVASRHHLTKLGSGYKGGVHQAILKIDDVDALVGELALGNYCTVAVKSDHCHSFTTYLFSARSSRSCLQPWSLLWNDASYLGGEYTGGLVFQALLESHSVEKYPGIVPTWAMIHDTDNPVWSRLPRRWLQGAPHPDASLKGIVMPLMDYTPLNQLTKKQVARLAQNTTYLSHMMLPAAEGLVFVNHLGLAFQDILKTNLGITNDWSHALIFDNTYLALQQQPQQQPQQQQQQQQQDNADSNNHCPKDQVECQFCPEPVFGAANYTKHRLGNQGALDSDRLGFLNILLWLLEQVPERRQAWKLKQSLTICDSMPQIAEVLRIHAAKLPDPVKQLSSRRRTSSTTGGY